MKRAARLAILFLVLGAVVNIAVAWACAIWIDVRSAPKAEASAGPPGYAGSMWSVCLQTTPGGALVFSQRFSGSIRESGTPAVLAPRWTGFGAPTDPYADGAVAFESRLAEGRGWPLLALWSIIENPYAPEPELRGGIDVGLRLAGTPDRLRNHRVLPLRPIPSGFLVNTLLYAAIVFLPRAPWEARRVLRIRREQCLKCGYPIGRSSVCTECGCAIES